MIMMHGKEDIGRRGSDRGCGSEVQEIAAGI